MKTRQKPPLESERLAAPAASNREVSLRPGTWNPEQRTLEVVWTTGSRGVRLNWATFDLVDEELATDASNVRLERLNAGAPVLDTHDRSELSNQIGVVVPGTARMEGGQGIATLKLSARADVEQIVSDIGEGLIRNLSVGYAVHSYEVIENDGERPLYRAIDWEPTEISFVPVPFDMGAQVRSLTPAPPRLPQERVITGTPATIAQLRSFMDLARDKLPADERAELVLDMAERSYTIEQAQEATMRFLADRQHAATRNISNFTQVRNENTFDNPEFFGRAIEDALYSRMTGSAPSDQAREFMGMGLVQIAGRMLERSGVRGVGGMTANEVLNSASWNRASARGSYMGDQLRSAGMHSTSDFPDLLTAAGNRYLVDVFAGAESPLKQVSRERTASDFRALSGLQLSGFGRLNEVVESGEITQGTFKSRKESYQLKTFAKGFAITRQAIINDDLGAFGDPIRIMGRAAAETEAGILAGLIEANPVMGDGVALFHATHGNLAATGALPSIATLSAARQAMRDQKDMDGVTPISAAPRFIVSSTKDETAVEQLVSATPGLVGVLPDLYPFVGKMAPLVEPRFTGTGWYLFADPALAPVIEYAYLDGQRGPKIETKDGWETLGQEFRVYMDFGAGLVDHRGAYRNPGA